MKFGIYLNPQTHGRDSDRRVLQDVLGQVDYAAEHGFHSVWLTEHHFTGYNVYSDPIALAAAFSQRIPGMEIGFSLGVVPFHHPVRFAEQCALIDQLCDGRLTVGVGPGNCPDEYDGYGLDRALRREMTDEFVDIMERAWTAPETGFRYDGQFWQGVVRGRICPAPVQSPYPRVAWGTTTYERLDLVGERGWSWLIASGYRGDRLRAHLGRYLRALERHHDADRVAAAYGGTASVQRILITEPGEDWEAEAGASIRHFIRQSSIANFGVDHQSPEEVAARAQYYTTPAFVGTAEQLVERMRPYAEFGVGTAMCWFNFGDMPDAIVRRSIDRFEREVAPALQSFAPKGDLFAELRSAPDNGDGLAGPI